VTASGARIVITDLFPWAIGVVAFLYAAVGHAGATGYVAVMALAGVAPAEIRPAALVLNVVVAAIGTVQFARAGHMRLGLLVPLAVASAPCAWLGATLTLPVHWLEALLGAVLAWSAVRQAGDALRKDQERVPQPLPRALPLWQPALLGALVGLLSGLTGVGGGIFLTPALLAARVAPLKKVAGVTAPFILVNSIAGLAALSPALEQPMITGKSVILAAAIGGLLGAQAGAFQLPVRSLRLVLAVVLGIASLKMLSASMGVG
jgi:uncharacterized membrane protein YfcA